MDHLGILNLFGTTFVELRDFLPQWIHKWLGSTISSSHLQKQGCQVAVDMGIASSLDALCEFLTKQNSAFSTKMGAQSITPLPFRRSPSIGKPTFLPRVRKSSLACLSPIGPDRSDKGLSSAHRKLGQIA